MSPNELKLVEKKMAPSPTENELGKISCLMKNKDFKKFSSYEKLQISKVHEFCNQDKKRE